MEAAVAAAPLMFCKGFAIYLGKDWAFPVDARVSVYAGALVFYGNVLK